MSFQFFWLDQICKIFFWQKFLKAQAEFLIVSAEIACWDLANIWFGKWKEEQPNS
jgi:hypothetical protein